MLSAFYVVVIQGGAGVKYYTVYCSILCAHTFFILYLQIYLWL